MALCIQHNPGNRKQRKLSKPMGNQRQARAKKGHYSTQRSQRLSPPAPFLPQRFFRDEHLAGPAGYLDNVSGEIWDELCVELGFGGDEESLSFLGTGYEEVYSKSLAKE